MEQKCVLIELGTKSAVYKMYVSDEVTTLK